MAMIRGVVRHHQGNQEHQANQGSDCYQGNQEHHANQGSELILRIKVQKIRKKQSERK